MGRRFCFLFSVIVGMFSCTAVKSPDFPDVAVLQSDVIPVPGEETPVFNGGFGSAVVWSASDTCFYLLTDRGPNVDGQTPESKVFVVPEFVPQIGKFRLCGDSLIRLETILLRDTGGHLFDGLPNVGGDGATGETAYDLNGNVICSGRRGIDTEGLALAPDGSFWVSDEYGPFILHFDKKGNLLDEISPFNGGLPSYFANRRPNRGMEGLTISKDGKTLYGIMQSPLYLPDSRTKDDSRNLRLVKIDLETRRVQEYLYVLEDSRNMVSELCWLPNGMLLVLERDGKFLGEGSVFKKVFRISLIGATNISENQEIELLDSAGLQNRNIYPVSKSLYCDISESIPGYPHDKPEGITMIGDSILVVANDDDFGITASEPADGKIYPKFIWGTDGRRDKNELYFIRISSR